MANFAILIWPLVSLGLFLGAGPARGLIWSVVVGYLFLPENWYFDFPLMPPYGKAETISLGLLLGLLATRGKLPVMPESDKAVKFAFGAILALLVLSPFVTMLTNRDVQAFGPNVMPAIRLWDVQSYLFGLALTLVPFFLARRLLHEPEMHAELLKALVIMALFYSMLVLYEVRMSPQLNNIVYGYFPHSWFQHIREGGWRPLVFLLHGLDLGFFLLSAVLATAGLVRTGSPDKRMVYFCGLIFLLGILALSRNLGALAICLMLLTVALMTTLRFQIRVAFIVAVLFATYPLLRDGYVASLVAVAERVSEERATSLAFRFENENMLAAHAAERPLGGWGPWGRWHVHDPVTGQALTVSDGVWIIKLGEWGWLGFLGFFGLILLPLILSKRTLKHQQLSSVTAVMLLITAANLIYMIPNSTFTPVGWLMAGALMGYVQFAPGRVGTTEPEATDWVSTHPRQIPYTRFQHRHASTSSSSGPRRHSHGLQRESLKDNR